MAAIVALGLGFWAYAMIDQGGFMSWKDFIWPPFLIAVATAIYITQRPKKT